MDSKVFRKSSIDRLKSPEQLNTYIRVTGTGVWIVLIAVILLLTGALTWGVFGTVELAETGESIHPISFIISGGRTDG